MQTSNCLYPGFSRDLLRVPGANGPKVTEEARLYLPVQEGKGPLVAGAGRTNHQIHVGLVRRRHAFNAGHASQPPVRNAMLCGATSGRWT